MASWQWGRTMVTIDGCKLLVDHGEAQGVGVTKLPKEKGLRFGAATTLTLRDSTSGEVWPIRRRNRPGPRFDM